MAGSPASFDISARADNLKDNDKPLLPQHQQASHDSGAINSLPRRNRQKCAHTTFHIPISILNARKLTEEPPQKNPLHITIFPSQPSNKPLRTPLQFSLILSSTLDIFEARSKANVSSGGGLSGDFGLLHAIDERLAAYGFETNTGVRFVAIVDMRGRIVGDDGARSQVTGLRDGEMKLVSCCYDVLRRKGEVLCTDAGDNIGV